MKAYLKGAIVGLALLVSGVLVSPSAQVQIQRGWNVVSGYLDIIGPSSTWKFTPSGTSLLLQASTGGAFSTVGTFTSGGNFTAEGRITGVGLTSMSDVVVATGQYLTFGSLGSMGAPATDGAFRLRDASGNNTFDITLADWGTTLSAESVSWTDTEVKAGPTSGVGTLTLSIGTDNNVCVFALTGTAAPVELNDPGGICSITAATATSVNVYYSAGYQIQNLRGGARAIRAVFVGG